MVAHSRPFDAEDFSYKILVKLEGAPSRWKSDAGSEARRAESAIYLEEWFGEHAASPDTPEAYESFDRMVQKITNLYPSKRNGAAQIADTAQVLLDRYRPSHLQELSNPPTHKTPDTPTPSVSDTQRGPALLQRLGQTARGLLQKEVAWYRSKAPVVADAVQISMKTGSRIAGAVAEKAGQTWENEKRFYEENGRDLRRGAVKAGFVGLSMLSVYMHRVNRLNPIKAKADVEYSDTAMTRWAAQYTNYFQALIKKSGEAHPDRGYSRRAYTVEHHHYAGFGTEIDSPQARRTLADLGIDRHSLMHHKVRLSEQEALLLLHAEAERFANRSSRLEHTDKMSVMARIHAGNDLLIAEIDGFPDQGAAQNTTTARYPVRAHHKATETHVGQKSVAETQKEPRSETKHKEPHTGKATTPQESVAKAGITTKKPHSHAESVKKLAAPRLRTNARTGLRHSKSDYIDYARFEQTRAKLRSLPPRRVGDPTDPFYEVFAEMMVSLERLKLTMYHDGKGHPTIGVGHLLKHVKEGWDTREITDRVLGPGMFDHCMNGGAITKRQAMDLVKYHTMENEKKLCADKKIGLEHWIEAGPEREAGLLSVAFNGGVGLVHKGICKDIRQKDYKAAGEKISHKLNRGKDKGVYDRRLEEGAHVSGEEEFFPIDVASQRVSQQIASIPSRSVLRMGVPDEDYLKKLLKRVDIRQPTVVQDQENPDSLIAVHPRTEALERISWQEATARYGSDIADNGPEFSGP